MQTIFSNIMHAGCGTRIGVSVRCREVTWLSRAIAGATSMAAAISGADKNLSLVNLFSI